MDVYASKNVCVKDIISGSSMVLRNYQNLIEMTSNIFHVIAFGVRFKCPHKIHLNTCAVEEGGGGQTLASLRTKKTTEGGGGHCVFKWILCGHLKPTPNTTI